MSAKVNIRKIPGDQVDHEHAAEFLASMGPLASPGGQEVSKEDTYTALMKSVPSMRARYPPLERCPCANVQTRMGPVTVCENPGNLICGACRLVSYCSKGCQKLHWQDHKRDCKNPMRSDKWNTQWAEEQRRPAFVNDVSLERELASKFGQSLSVGLSLWGTTPAVDLINFTENEHDLNQDISIALAASGDLRHVIKTVNSLPTEYSGELTILLNDGSFPIAYRNLILLLILGAVEDRKLAAEIALHFWYSLFLPLEYHFHIIFMLTKYLSQVEQPDDVFPLGKSSKLWSLIPPESRKYLGHFNNAETTVEDAQAAYEAVMQAPSRQDYRDRMYAKLKPSHRVAFEEFRRFGLLLPFGAASAHFNHPNSSLLSLEGHWWQRDFANPLEGWDVVEVQEAGNKHGATSEDIYGCLYFYLTDQLRMFAQRLDQFSIKFVLFPMDATDLAAVLTLQDLSGPTCGLLPPKPRFDRIFTSNILDSKYVGIAGVLEGWAPLLSERHAAAIVGYFMNWIFAQTDGRVRDAGKKVIQGAMKRYEEQIKDVGKVPPDAFQVITDLDAFYDNSRAFAGYLKKQGLETILKSTNLLLREKHTIVPHRLASSIKASSRDLPSFPDEASWYNYGRLSSFSWVERYVEFVRSAKGS